jgi:hypothetical protein
VDPRASSSEGRVAPILDGGELTRRDYEEITDPPFLKDLVGGVD